MGNFLMSCPVKPGRYYLHNWKLGNMDRIAFRVAGSYRSSVSFLTGESTYNKKFFDNFTLSIVNNTLCLDLDIIKPLSRGFRAHIEFQLSLGRSKKYQRVFAHVLDVCEVVTTIKNNIFKSWFQSMLQHGNFMYNCPVAKGHYFLHNWRLESRLVPTYLYAGDYRVKAHFFYGKHRSKLEDFIVDLIVYAQLKPS
ncbi:uncharacterized protein LOC115632845 [Scaptodrosophila lebanonensis]|uniref:Uncharacterized protein LOC115632845 n=1 Tax=Drosophila lebanonensis TaxID=7225 RepID=A0A6J2UFS9_DROLE|nr:uncharacterized protein LOC115632845 [Scaptodrosophila lebanonensis]